MAAWADEAAFSAFYGRTSRALWAYVYRATRSAADADDIVQDAFCRIVGADVETLDDEERRRYLFRIAGNLMTDRWRRSAREQSWLEWAGRALRGPDPDMARLTASSRSVPGSDPDMARTFAALKPRERALLWLAYVEEQNHQEIATALGLARGSVKVLLSRARRRLRDLLAASGMIGVLVVDRLLPDLSEADERVVADYMAGLAELSVYDTPALPPADLVWVKANLVRRWESERQAQRPIDAMQALHVGLGLVAAVVLFVWSAPALFHSLSVLRP